MADQIPVVDMRDWSHPDGRRGFISNLGAALEEYGFVRVTGHVVSPTLVDEAYHRLSEFFDRPMDEKRRYYLEGTQGQRGYTPFRMEHAKDQTLPDLQGARFGAGLSVERMARSGRRFSGQSPRHF